MLGDMELLRDYAATNSEVAFATLVSRHINLVHAAAMRQTGNAAHAEEITQAVFIILAKKAASLRPGTVLSGWLFHTTRLTAANFLRSEIRRTRREQEAYMQSELQTSAGDDAWRQIAPLLDQAINTLGEKDRNAVVLRYVEGKDFKEVGAGTGSSESAAQRRVSRAIEKLRKYFTKRGVVLTGAVLAGAVAANAAPAAPAGLVTSVSTMASLQGATAGASAVALTNSTLKLLMWAKVKFAAGIAAAALAVAGGGFALEQSSLFSRAPRFADGLSAADIARKVEAKYASLTSYQDSGFYVSAFYPTMADYRLGTNRTPASANSDQFSIRLARPGLFLVESIVRSTNTSPSTRESLEMSARHVGWSSGEGNFGLNYIEEHLSHLDGSDGPYHAFKLLAHPKLCYKVDQSTALVLSGSVIIPDIFFNGDASLLRGLGASFLHAGKLTRGPDEQVGGVDCYVLTNKVTPAKDLAPAFDIGITWIGKNDLLVHQTCEVGLSSKEEVNVGAPAVFTGTETHENIVIDESLTANDFKFEPPSDTVFTNFPMASSEYRSTSPR